MTGGGTFTFTGAQDLTVPVNSIIAKNSSGNFYRLTLNNTGTAEQVIVTNNNLGNTINIMPLGASITFGTSATGTAKNGTNIVSYNGSGYHSQLYQDLVNDGRFNPNFVGSVTDPNNTGAVNASGPSILSTVGQTANEGHPGITNSGVLNNLNSNGNWLAPGNGVNPNYIALNVGGNDFQANSTDTNAVLRYDAIISQANSLRPGVATLVSSLMYRTDVGASQNTYYNPSVPGIVYNHALAGQNVRYLDLYSLLSPGDNPNILGSDGIHPIQAAYDKEADAWSQSLLYGAAYYKGGNNSVWSSVNSTTNFAVDSGLTTDRQKSLDDPSAITYAGYTAQGGNTTLTFYPDVWFNNNTTALSTTLGADQTIRSLNFASGATGSVSVGGANTLTIGAGGITVQPGTGAHTVSANVALSAAQTWGNVSSNPFTVSGVVSGSNNLTTTGSYTTYNPGSSVSGVNLPTANTYVVSGSIVLAGNNTYTGTTTISSGTLQIGNGGATGTLGSGAVTDNGVLVFNRSDTGQLISSAIGGTGKVTQAGAGTTTLTAANTYTGATTITAGTLQVGSGGASPTGSIANTSALSIAAGATLITAANGAVNNANTNVTINGGTITNANTAANGTGGLNTGTPPTNNAQTLGTLILGGGANSILDFGAGNTGAIYQFAKSSGAPWNGTLSVYNWAGNYPTGTFTANGSGKTGGDGLDELFFGSDATGLTTTQLSGIKFYSDQGQTLLGGGINTILADGEVSPAPEPAQTAALGLFGLGLGALVLKAKKRKAAGVVN